MIFYSYSNFRLIRLLNEVLSKSDCSGGTENGCKENNVHEKNHKKFLPVHIVDSREQNPSIGGNDPVQRVQKFTECQPVHPLTPFQLEQDEIVWL